MANARIARFVTEVAPPQFVNVMRNRASKMLETIKEEEREASTSESLSLKNYSTSSSSAYSASSSNAKSSKYFLKEVQRTGTKGLTSIRCFPPNHKKPPPLLSPSPQFSSVTLVSLDF
uniref:Uncharacterized protein n=1 Tax=Solanum lycopersicum TaxID=4081 RepID=A0A3Q7HZL0_SOLLC